MEKKYMLNPLLIITEQNNTMQFIDPYGKGLINFQLSDDEKNFIKKLISLEYQEIDYLKNNLKSDNFKKMIELNWLVEKSPDIDSIFCRNKSFYQMFSVKEGFNLDKKSILILGCGGIGSHLAWQMCTMGIGEITIVDFDKVEQSNLNRQLFNLDDIGKYKVDALEEKLLKTNPNIIVNKKIKNILNETDLKNICLEKKYDLIIKSLDSPAEISKWLDNICKENKLSYITGITTIDKAMIGPSYLPDISKYGFSDLIPIETITNKLSGVMPSLGVILHHISSELAMEAFNILTKNTDNLKYIDKIYIDDILNNSSHIITKQKNKNSFKYFIDLIITILLSLFLNISNIFVFLISCILLPLLISNNNDEYKGIVLLNGFSTTLCYIIKEILVFPWMNYTLSYGLFNIFLQFIYFSFICIIFYVVSGIIKNIIENRQLKSTDSY